MLRFILLLIFLSIGSTNITFAAHHYLLAMNANMQGLRYTNNDRNRMVNALTQHFKNRLSVYQLDNVTLNSYRSMMGQLKRVVQPNDQVIIYFSGHGTQVLDRDGDEVDRLDEALVTYNSNGQINFDNLLLDDELANDINQLAARYIIVIMDTCHAGGMYKKPLIQGIAKYINNPHLTHVTPKQLMQENTSSIWDDAKGVLFAAASENQLAIEDNAINGSIFTREFSFFLSKNNNIEKAFALTKKAVRRITNQRQIPDRSNY